jgi:hypothetical protein
MTNQVKIASMQFTLYSEPNESSEVICKIKEGTELIINSINGKFVDLVTVYGVEGYTPLESFEVKS